MYSRKICNLSRARVDQALFEQKLPPLKEYSLSDVALFEEALGEVEWPEEGSEATLKALPKEAQEYIRNNLLLSQIDFEYWCERFCTISSSDADLVKLKLRPSQRFILDKWAAMEESEYPLRAGKIGLVVAKARRAGATVISQAAIAHGVMLRPNAEGFTASDVPEHSLALYEVQTRIFDNLPGWMKPHIVGRVKSQHFKFDLLDSKLDFGSGAQKNPMGQGLRKDYIHLTEVSTWQYPDQIDQDLLPAFLGSGAPTCLFILESTGKGGMQNNFYQTYQAAKRNEGFFRPLFIGWQHVPELHSMPAEGVEISKPVLQMAERLKRENGFECTKEQLAWYEVTRQQFASKNDLQSLLSEYPSCLVAGTRISTERGIIPIEQASDALKTESGEIEACLIQKPAQIYRLTTKDGRVLRGTGEHPISTPDGFVRLDELKVDASITLQPPMFAERPYIHCWNPQPAVESRIEITPEMGRWLGYFVGDGSYCRRTLDFACDLKDRDVADDIISLTEQLFGLKLHSRITGSKGGCLNLRVTSNQLAHPLFSMGVLYGNPATGSFAREVCVPEAIWRSPKNVVREFLRGLLESDGGASAGHLTFSGKGQKFVQDVQLLLLGFGITSRIRRQTKWFNGHECEWFSLNCRKEETLRFYDEIGFVGSRKAGYRPVVEMRGRRTKQPMPIVFVDEVLAIVPDGVEETFNLRIAKTHIFSANGILTHNSDDEAFQSGLRSVFPLEIRNEIRNEVRTPLMVCEWDEEKLKFGPNLAAEWNSLPEEKRVMDQKLFVWESPRKGSIYVIGVDVSQGLEEGDPASVEVLRVGNSHEPDEQVAEWRGLISPRVLAHIAFQMGDLFKDKVDDRQAKIAVELNGPGQVTQMVLEQLGYTYFYFWRPPFNAKRRMTTEMGWVTNVRTRTLMTKMGVDYLKRRELKINSPGVVDEMGTYILIMNSTGSQIVYDHAPGCHDDRLMACHPPETLVMTSEGNKHIEDIVVGDRVLTHVGRFRRVLQTMQREADGLVRIRSSGQEDILATPEHPIWASCIKEQYKDNSFMQTSSPEWIEAGILNRSFATVSPSLEVVDSSVLDLLQYAPGYVDVDGFLEHRLYGSRRNPKCNPVKRFIEVNDEFCRMVGYFLAEGSTGTHQTTWASHKREEPVRHWLIDYLHRAFSLRGVASKCSSALGWEVRVGSVPLRNFMRSAFGHKAWLKKLPEWMLKLPVAKKREILVGYLAGDGSLVGGRIRANSVSSTLTHQMRLLATSVRWPTNIRRYGGRNGKRPQWSLSFSSGTSLDVVKSFPHEWLLAKRWPFPSVRWNQTAAKCREGRLLTRIRTVEELEYQGPVYNIEVEEDNSYLANGQVVHNCFIALYVAHEDDQVDMAEERRIEAERDEKMRLRGQEKRPSLQSIIELNGEPVTSESMWRLWEEHYSPRAN